MSQTTSIEWTGSTWNPIRARLKPGMYRDYVEQLIAIGDKRSLWGYHCERISPGCQNCYAERMNCRTLPAWGTGLDYNVPNREKVEIYLDEAELLKPLSWKKPRKIFPCSMTDLFAEFVPDEMIDRVFAVMALSPQHTFQVLTKRAERLHSWFESRPAHKTEGNMQRTLPGYLCRPLLAGLYGTHLAQRNWTDGRWPLPNVHLGVSVEDQQRADERIPHLLATPAVVRWVSYEPALGPVDFDLPRCEIHDREFAYMDDELRAQCCSECRADGAVGEMPYGHWLDPLNGGINWIVVGGESGPGARPFDIAWAHRVIAQCKAAGVPVFVKQLGAKPEVAITAPIDGHRWQRRVPLKDRKGGDPDEWPEDLRVREYPR